MMCCPAQRAFSSVRMILICWVYELMGATLKNSISLQVSVPAHLHSVRRFFLDPDQVLHVLMVTIKCSFTCKSPSAA